MRHAGPLPPDAREKEIRRHYAALGNTIAYLSKLAILTGNFGLSEAALFFALNQRVRSCGGRPAARADPLSRLSVPLHGLLRAWNSIEEDCLRAAGR